MDFSGLFGNRSTAPGPAETAPCESCPLLGLQAGRRACLVCVNVGNRLKRRLAELGLTPGVEMMVLQNDGGPLLISVRDSRLALGRGMAARVEVAPLSGGNCG